MNRLCAEDHGNSMTRMREMTGVGLDSLFGAYLFFVVGPVPTPDQAGGRLSPRYAPGARPARRDSGGPHRRCIVALPATGSAIEMRQLFAFAAAAAALAAAPAAAEICHAFAGQFAKELSRQRVRQEGADRDPPRAEAERHARGRAREAEDRCSSQ
ncbi:MAG TPA: hypothetical protein VII40_02820 [Xanthobacteraceae bacterium]